MKRVGNMSEEHARTVYREAENFSKLLASEGWIDETPFGRSETASPGDLFNSEASDRPLVVGLFGGTGVGKSSLLNRLAGDSIARTGVVRPTSMEITAYAYIDKVIASLPDKFPQQYFSEVRHQNTKFKDVLWIDMPDFDSEETQNRDQVLQWLPHIDLLLYVVTPERYKDEQGWRLLLENGYRHAWIFVMNQWDRAEGVQIDDFSRLLAKAGFANPQIYRTVGVKSDDGSSHGEDQFDQMAGFVSKLALRNIVAQLDQRGWLQRLDRAQQRIEEQTNLLAGAEKESTLVSSFSSAWEQYCVAAKTNLDLPFKEFSQQFETDKSAPIATALKSLTGSSKDGQAAAIAAAGSIAAQSDVTALWDDWSDTRLQDTIEQFELAEAAHGVPRANLLQARQSISADAAAEVKVQMRQHLDQALRYPGEPWQRLASKVLSVVQWLLPIAAVAWMGFRIINGFVLGAGDESAYVGLDFLVNGLLVVALSAVLPWVLQRLLRPSIPKSVYSALQLAVSDALQSTGEEYQSRLEEVSQSRKKHLEHGNQLKARVKSLADQSALLNSPDLERLLVAASSVNAPEQ